MEEISQLLQRPRKNLRPILGTLPEMGSLAHRKLATLATSLNAKRLMALSLGASPVVISSHPHTAREILCGPGFSDRPVKESHDSSIWEDPWAFKPERFMKEDLSIMGSDMRLAPFGAGRRVCPGKALGLATVHVRLAQFLRHFIWVPVQPVDLAECLKLSLELKKPLLCQVIRRYTTTISS